MAGEAFHAFESPQADHEAERKNRVAENNAAPSTDPKEELDWRVTEAIVALARRLPGYWRLALALVRDPRIPAPARRWVVGAGLYNFSPIDPVPGVIPVLGQLDDYAILVLAVRKALRAASAEVREEHLVQAHVTMDQIDADLSEMRRIARHVTRRAAWGVWAGLQFAAGMGVELGRQLVVGAARAVNPQPRPPGGKPKEEAAR
jgi:uncharacterized membrane protein YkvA (DUF1232 family)